MRKLKTIFPMDSFTKLAAPYIICNLSLVVSKLLEVSRLVKCTEVFNSPFYEGQECVVDIDIDDTGGLEHIFQVVKTKFTGPTNPFVIHDILVRYQKLDPGSKFLV